MNDEESFHFCNTMRSILQKSLSPSTCRLVSFHKKAYIPDNFRTKAFLLVLSASYSSATRLPIEPTANIMCKTDAMSESFSKSIWDGSDKASFDSLDHCGYSLESNPENGTGGWLAHRKVWEKTDDDDEPTECWVKDLIPLITKFDYESMEIGRAPRILVLYGSLRPTSFSKKCAYEFARLLDLLGCDVRVYNPKGLPVRDPSLEEEPKVVELRALTHWSDG